jgi:hypothetical protein
MQESGQGKSGGREENTAPGRLRLDHDQLRSDSDRNWSDTSPHRGNEAQYEQVPTARIFGAFEALSQDKSKNWRNLKIQIAALRFELEPNVKSAGLPGKISPIAAAVTAHALVR